VARLFPRPEAAGPPCAVLLEPKPDEVADLIRALLGKQTW